MAHFYPRSPCGERRVAVFVSCAAAGFLSTLSLRRATYPAGGVKTCSPISIHALLAESDGFLRMGSTAETPFLSTLSLRRATPSPHRTGAYPRHFYPRSPCGERPLFRLCMRFRSYFYPRSPCGERQQGKVCKALANRFLSTLSLRRATINAFTLVSSPIYFYPRSPCGERQGAGMFGRRDTAISIHALLAESDANRNNMG